MGNFSQLMELRFNRPGLVGVVIILVLSNLLMKIAKLSLGFSSIVYLDVMESLIFRFGNILQMTELSVHKIWRIVKQVKKETSLDKKCSTNNLYIDYSDRESQVVAFEQKLGIEPSKIRLNNLNQDYLKDAAEMFVYLNACPGGAKGDMIKGVQKWFTSWLTFYKKIFEVQYPGEILLTLNRMMKSGTQRDITFEINHRIFKRIRALLPLNYSDIQQILITEKYGNVLLL